MLVRLVLLGSLGFLALSALVAVTVGKAIQGHLDPEDQQGHKVFPASPVLRVVPPAPRAIRDRPARTGHRESQARREHPASRDRLDPKDR